MNSTQFIIDDIDAIVFGTRYQHKVLIYEPWEQILSYPAIWLSQFQYKTGFEYAKILRRFLNYISTEVPFFEDKNNLLSFWLYINTDMIKAWKTYRIKNKLQEEKYHLSPTFDTIDREASIVCKFLDWVKFDKGVNTFWDGKRKIIEKANRIHDDFLKGIARQRTVEVIDINTNVSFFLDNKDIPLEGLARRYQTKPHEYLHDDQVKVLVNSFPDKVYKYICLTAYITGLRDFEVLAIPYWHMFQDKYVFTSDPTLIKKRLNEKILLLKVLGKRQKLREVKFDIISWLKIMEKWAPLYFERKRLFENKNGRELPLEILWLDKLGNPIFCPPQNGKEHEKSLKKIEDAFYYVSVRNQKNPLSIIFGRNVDYYCLRHTYATNYVLRVMEARKEREKDKYIEDFSLRHDLANQMGHSTIDTTFAKYVDNAIIILKDLEAGKSKISFPNLEDLLLST